MSLTKIKNIINPQKSQFMRRKMWEILQNNIKLIELAAKINKKDWWEAMLVGKLAKIGMSRREILLQLRIAVKMSQARDLI